MTYSNMTCHAVASQAAAGTRLYFRYLPTNINNSFAFAAWRVPNNHITTRTSCLAACHSQFVIVITGTLYLPSCLGQETVKLKGSFRLRVILHLPICLPQVMESSHYHFLLLNIKQGSHKYIPISLVFGLTCSGIERRSTISIADVLLTQPLISTKLICYQSSESVTFFLALFLHCTTRKDD